jgi:hypothetical protein
VTGVQTCALPIYIIMANQKYRVVDELMPLKSYG